MNTGQSQVVWVAGEVGIGKSRLVAETKQIAADHHMTIRQGNCFEPDRTLPYAPLLDLLRTLRREMPAAAELIALLSGRQSQSDADPEAAKRRLFTVLADFLLSLPHGAAEKEAVPHPSTRLGTGSQ